MSTIKLDRAAADSVDVDALVIGVAQGEDGPLLVGAEAVDEAFGGRLREALAAAGATGKAGEVTRLATLGAVTARTLAAVGLGQPPAERPDRYEAETVRRAAGAAARALAGSRSVALALPSGAPELVAAAAEGALLGAYAFRRYRHASAADHKEPVEEFSLLANGAAADGRRGDVRADAGEDPRGHRCGETVPGPGQHPALRPASEGVRGRGGRRGAAASTCEVEVLDEVALRAGGYGGIVGVGQGSVNPPGWYRSPTPIRTRRASWRWSARAITFDSGGLSLKPAHSMEWMKSDMGGAAAVLAAMTAIARLGVERRRHRLGADGREHALGLGDPPVATSSPCTAARRSRCSTPTPRAG